MKVIELVGKDIMKAYDGNYLSQDFGYSYANFNIKDDFSGGYEQNDEAMFDFYTLNKKNVSCFVCYDNNNKICGRRMLFKGKSLLNHIEFSMPYKMWSEVIYLYGYYGAHNGEIYRLITNAVVNKYGDKLIHTDRYVIVNGRPNYKIENLFILQVDRADFQDYPPIDFLKIAPSIRALTNFNPSDEVIEVLKKDLKIKDIEFFGAYRYNPDKFKNYKYTTWGQHHGKATSSDDTTFIQEEDDEEEDMILPEEKLEHLKVGDTLTFKSGGTQCKISKIADDGISFCLPNGREVELSKESVIKFFII